MFKVNICLKIYISLFEVNDSFVWCRKSLLLASYLKWLSLRSQNPETCFTLTTQYFQLFMSLLCLFILFLVLFGLLSGHLLGKSCLLGWAKVCSLCSFLIFLPFLYFSPAVSPFILPQTWTQLFLVRAFTYNVYSPTTIIFLKYVSCIICL